MVIQEEAECRIIHTVLIATKVFVQYVQVAGRERGAYSVCRNGDGAVMVGEELRGFCVYKQDKI